jgi:endonuclease-3
MHSLFIIFKRRKHLMAEDRARQILTILEETFTTPRWVTSSRDPFRTLIVTIISQNTADRNTSKAFENLSNRFRIVPEELAKAETAQVEECLRVAGLYRNKARNIQQVSRIILKQFHGSLDEILSLPLEEARRTLLQLPGVGPKTADVVLLFSAGKPTIPVDTHVNRVSRRLGFAPDSADYETVRNRLQVLYCEKDYAAVHVLLILHGRKYCKARSPICKECPVNEFCPSRHKWDKHD